VRYRLILLTDGRGLLQDTLESVLAHVRPRPAQVYAHADARSRLITPPGPQLN
jgi:hypothetical protein